MSSLLEQLLKNSEPMGKRIHNDTQTIFIDPSTDIAVRVKIADEIISNLEYAKKYRPDGWGDQSLEAIKEYKKNMQFAFDDAFVVPSECISYLMNSKKYPNTAEAIKRGYHPNGLKSNNGVPLFVGKHVVVSYQAKYGGTKKRRIRKITESGIYFDGMHVPVPVGDTHRIYVAP